MQLRCHLDTFFGTEVVVFTIFESIHHALSQTNRGVSLLAPCGSNVRHRQRQRRGCSLVVVVVVAKPETPNPEPDRERGRLGVPVRQAPARNEFVRIRVGGTGHRRGARRPGLGGAGRQPQQQERCRPNPTTKGSRSFVVEPVRNGHLRGGRGARGFADKAVLSETAVVGAAKHARLFGCHHPRHENETQRCEWCWCECWCECEYYECWHDCRRWFGRFVVRSVGRTQTKEIVVAIAIAGKQEKEQAVLVGRRPGEIGHCRWFPGICSLREQGHGLYRENAQQMPVVDTNINININNNGNGNGSKR
mmetsp:Transcript_23427/g.47892  ORF Transcript_23427/g.47892 Transcript_23427/m.47892 type:complete len:306 (+) Transcript_23427:108-1025(+)